MPGSPYTDLDRPPLSAARLQRAQDLLPAPLEGRGLEVGLALEMAYWLGTGPER